MKYVLTLKANFSDVSDKMKKTKKAQEVGKTENSAKTEEQKNRRIEKEKLVK